MSKNKKSILEKNLTRIFLLHLQSDKEGELIAYCDYPWHRGVIGNGKAKECIAKNCRYVRVFREEYK
jgi:hypothetical protein